MIYLYKDYLYSEKTHIKVYFNNHFHVFQNVAPHKIFNQILWRINKASWDKHFEVIWILLLVRFCSIILLF